jgi:hypothetical protein
VARHYGERDRGQQGRVGGLIMAPLVELMAVADGARWSTQAVKAPVGGNGEQERGRSGSVGGLTVR